MGCNSGSVQSVADKTIAAKEQIDRLNATIESQKDVIKARFYKEIDDHLASANVDDAREISYNYDIKTEYTSEFSLDKIAGVVTSAMKALAAAKDPSTPNPATSPEAIEAYSNVVNSVAEAAKSSSTAAASLSFSMNRLGPGLFAFLYATSTNIKDEGTFGSEAVTTTAIFHRIVESIKDLKNEAEFNAAEIDASSYLRMKKVQAGLIDDLASEKLTTDEYAKKDAAFDTLVAKLKAKLDANHFNVPASSASKLLKSANVIEQSDVSAQEVALRAVETLKGMGGNYKSIIIAAQQRISSGYFLK